jgi:cellobiose-specific phosphotransferase system component IIC
MPAAAPGTSTSNIVILPIIAIIKMLFWFLGVKGATGVGFGSVISQAVCF